MKEELKFLQKFKKNRGGGVDWVGWGGGQGGCERRIEVFVKIQKKIGESGGGGVGSEGRLGIRVGVNKELKFEGWM